MKTSAIISGGASVTLADGNDAGTGIGAVSVKARSVTSSTAKVLPAKPAANQINSDEGGGDGDSGDSADDESSKQSNQSNATNGGSNDVPKSNDSNDAAKDQSKSESGSNGDGENGGSSSSSVGVAASVAVNVLSVHNTAIISHGASVTAGGSVTLVATGLLTMTMVGGSVGVGGTAGIGASNTTLVHNDIVEARVGDFANVTTGGSGLSVSATSTEDVITVAAAGAADGTAGIAGAAVVNVLNETTTAAIGHSVTVTATNGVLAGESDINVSANDTTTIVSVAGSLAAAGSAAAGVGVDVDVAKLSKLTTAFIDSNVVANVEGDVLVHANSKEDLTSVAAGLAAGSVAVAVDASVHVLELQTRAFIGDDPGDQVASAGVGHVHASGSIVVAADDQSETDRVVGVLAAGSVGVATGIGVSVTSKTTEAFIGNGAKVTADGHTAGRDVRTGRYVESFVTPANAATPGIQSNSKPAEGNDPAVQSDISATATVGDLSAKGEVGLPKTVETDTTDKDNPSDQGLTTDRVITPEVRSGFHGLSVTATNRDDIETYTISAAGGSVAVAVSAGVNVIDNDTRAYIGQNALVNDDTSTGNGDQSVNVAAGSDFAHIAFAGAIAGGAVGVGPAASITVLSNTTEAYIGWDGAVQNPQTANATAKARNDVLVAAHQTEDMLLVGIGFGGGTVGIGAGVDVLSIDNDTRAAIGPNSTVFAGGDVFVNASDITDFDVLSGGGGAGLAGVGGAVGVTVVTKDTQAWIDSDATVDGQGAGTGITGIFNGDMRNANSFDGDDADGFATSTAHGVIVQASSSEQIFHFAGAVGAGFVGVAGGVTVTLVDSNTSADIRDGAQINQTDTLNANGNQSVFVNAANEARIITFAGAAAGGAGAAAGGVDYGTLNNDTLAGIGKNANVNAKNDVEVNAIGIKELDALAFSAGVGAVGLAGTVSVWSIGVQLQKTYSDENGTSANAGKGSDGKTADDDAIQQTQAGKSEIVGGLGSFSKPNNSDAKSNNSRVDGITSSAGSKLGTMAPSQNSLTTSLNNAPATSGTSAFIGEGTTVTAGDDISVKANEDVEVQITVGAFAGGLVGVGAAVSILSVSANTSAISAGTLSAGNTIEVKALLNENVNVLALSGSAGFVGLGAAVVEFHDHSVVQAAINNVKTADSVTVLADANQALSVETGQVSAGAGAVGASFASLSADGEVSATVLPLRFDATLKTPERRIGQRRSATRPPTQGSRPKLRR